MTYAYLRVSTDLQTIENQRFIISNKYKVDRYFSDTISGTVDYHKRELGKLLKMARSNDSIVVSEISRLGRSVPMIFSIVDYCLKHKIKVICIKENITIDESITSRVLVFSFGLCAELERQLISQRTKEALARRKSMGLKVGGSVRGYSKIDRKCIGIEKYIGKRSKSWICKKYKISRPTLNKWLKK